MATKTYFKTNSNWIEVSNLWYKVAGIWKQRVIPWIKVSGVWKECMSYPAPTLTIAPTTFRCDWFGDVCSGFTTTIVVTASDGNSWTASRGSNTWITLNGGTSASGSGSGSFEVGCTKASVDRNGTVSVTSGAPTRNLTVQQVEEC